MDDKCPFCNSPSNNTQDKIECSNLKCWNEIDKYIKTLQQSGDTNDNPILLKCAQCNKLLSINYCMDCSAAVDCEMGKWYYTEYENKTCTTRFIGAPHFWDYDTQIRINK